MPEPIHLQERSPQQDAGARARKAIERLTPTDKGKIVHAVLGSHIRHVTDLSPLQGAVAHQLTERAHQGRQRESDPGRGGGIAALGATKTINEIFNSPNLQQDEALREQLALFVAETLPEVSSDMLAQISTVIAAEKKLRETQKA